MRVVGARDEEIDPQTVDWSSDRSPNFTVRQDSGGFNALGNLKIDMPNPYSVYMHDTTTRNLFANDYRFDFHGCTRVDNVRDLATWILEDVPPWNRAASTPALRRAASRSSTCRTRCRSPGSI